MTKAQAEAALEGGLSTDPFSGAVLPVVHAGRGTDRMFRLVDGVIESSFCTLDTYLDAVWGDDPFTDFPWRVAHHGDFSA